MLERQEVVDIGGTPSNRFFSTYSDICSLLTQIDDLPISRVGNYYTPGQVRLFTKLKAKIDEFNRSQHSHATSTEARVKKQREIDAVKALEQSMKDDREVLCAKVCKVLHDNVGSSIPLVRNSAAGWIRKFQQGEGSISIRPDLPGINAQWTMKDVLEIKPEAFFSRPDPYYPISLLVHEYHHLLTNNARPLYEDEFVAHWKQYVVWCETPLDDNGRAARINKFILVAYKDSIDPYPPKPILTRPQDARAPIRNFPDNA